MAPYRIPIILPVETQVRELDAKLLLACVAAEAGHAVIVGEQDELRANIASLPPGLFIAKGFSSSKTRFFKILKDLGFSVTAWDEEGLVRPEPEMYYIRRVSPTSLKLLDGVFSWGENYSDLFRSIPFYDGTDVFETGNPRIDLLRSDVRGYFNDDVAALQAVHGRYILLNSNFGRVNSAAKRRRDETVGGSATDPLMDARWRAMIEYRRSLYHHFRGMLAAVAKALPDYTIVLRPHPAEKIESWHDIEAAHANVRIIFEGNVVPWLLGAEVLIHNGCTTAIESTLLEKPVIAYQPITSDDYDWHLPNSLSHHANSNADLIAMLQNHLSGQRRIEVTPSQRSLLDVHIAHCSSKLASDLILDTIHAKFPQLPANRSFTTRQWAKADAYARTMEKRLRSLLPNDRYASKHQNKRFPELPISEIVARIGRLSRATGRFKAVRVAMIFPKTFRVFCD